MYKGALPLQKMRHGYAWTLGPPAGKRLYWYTGPIRRPNQGPSKPNTRPLYRSWIVQYKLDELALGHERAYTQGSVQSTSHGSKHEHCRHALGTTWHTVSMYCTAGNRSDVWPIVPANGIRSYLRHPSVCVTTGPSWVPAATMRRTIDINLGDCGYSDTQART